MRFMIIGAVVALAFTLYALVDAAMADGSRARGVSKPIWVVIVVLLPVIGGILWFTIGKGSVQTATVKRQAPPDDDPRFTGARMSDADLDVHMRELEDRLRELDDEVYPGEEAQESGAPASESESGGDTTERDETSSGISDTDRNADDGPSADRS